ncbi:hypothetical protein BDR06DRAFT_947035 [Suillus hirtellus]|nr:hypothetical protein BDR06DRAFT_947035 [Suillus hirtellus]
MDQYGQTPRTQTVNVNTQPTGTIPQSVYQNETTIIEDDELYGDHTQLEQRFVLAKHRSDAGHWVVHRFSLPDGSLMTYDSYPERTLPDGRPLGWKQG